MRAPIEAGAILAGKYRVEGVLGAGGMGFVLSATHLRLKERVAIKLLHPDLLQEEGLAARFLQEARAAASIRSEHVVRVRDADVLDDGRPYFVMEHIDGIDLDALVKRHGPLPVEVASEYALHVCEALAEAHAVGIIHRDLKPANLILTTRSDGSPVIKVLDFGISKVVSGLDGSAGATKTTEIRGSPLFMSPEHMRRSRRVDARADIWSLGVTLYHLLTRAYPFFSESTLEVCAMILQDEPRPVRSLRPDVPEGLALVLDRCLRKRPEQRYATIVELAAALADFAPPEARSHVERAARILLPVRVGGREQLPSVATLRSPSMRAEPPAPSHSSALAASPPKVQDCGPPGGPTTTLTSEALTLVAPRAGATRPLRSLKLRRSAVMGLSLAAFIGGILGVALVSPVGSRRPASVLEESVVTPFTRSAEAVVAAVSVPAPPFSAAVPIPTTAAPIPTAAPSGVASAGKEKKAGKPSVSPPFRSRK